MNLNATSHAYGQNACHIVLIPKCRYNYFWYQGIKTLCENTFHEIALKYNFKIISLEIQPNHVYLFVDFPPSYSISKVIQLFKGISAYKILHKWPHIRNTYLRRGHFWSAGKFYRSVGNVTADTIKHHIEQSQGSWTFEPQTKLKA